MGIAVWTFQSYLALPVRGMQRDRVINGVRVACTDIPTRMDTYKGFESYHRIVALIEMYCL